MMDCSPSFNRRHKLGTCIKGCLCRGKAEAWHLCDKATQLLLELHPQFTVWYHCERLRTKHTRARCLGLQQRAELNTATLNSLIARTAHSPGMLNVFEAAKSVTVRSARLDKRAAGTCSAPGSRSKSKHYKLSNATIIDTWTSEATPMKP